MLLASPVRLPFTPDLDLEFSIPGVVARLRALGRVVREAPEVDWPYLGYGVEFLFVPPDSQEALIDAGQRPRCARRRHPRPTRSRASTRTLRREDWIYEILEPVQHESVVAGGDPPRAARELAARAWPARSTWWRAARARACCARRRPSSRAIRIRRSERRYDDSPQRTQRAQTVRGGSSKAPLRSLRSPR